MVIIDGSGLVISSCSKKFQQAFSSTGIEALVAASALSFAAYIGINKAILEGDSLVVIKALNKPDIPLSSIGHWIEDAKIYSNSFIHLLSTLIQGDNKIVLLIIRQYMQLTFQFFLYR